MYFVQGILGLARLALTYFFKDELQLDPVRRDPAEHSRPWLHCSTAHTATHLSRCCSHGIRHAALWAAVYPAKPLPSR